MPQQKDHLNHELENFVTYQQEGQNDFIGGYKGSSCTPQN